jgi:hypothetical protein
METAALSAGRLPAEIKLVVVTKTQDIDAIQAVVDAGATDLGENYVEEAIVKINALKQNRNIIWHMVGHVQSRKAPLVCEYFQFLHSLDSVKLAEKLNRYALEINKTLPVWLEFNVGGEISKSGWNIENEEQWHNILPEFERLITFSGINLLGVMCIPPYSPDPETSRPYFRKLNRFQQFLQDKYHLNDFNGLSIGMSADFEIAIQEGSTCVRIGQAIFGPRVEKV